MHTKYFHKDGANIVQRQNEGQGMSIRFPRQNLTQPPLHRQQVPAPKAFPR